MNKQKLRDEMKKRGVSIKELYTMLGISRSAFYRKCNGISEFTLREMRMIVEYLHLESPVGIFFDEKVS